MIDNNGKLFGKINILDLSVIILIIAALAFGVMKFVFSEHKDNVKSEDIINYTIKIKAIRIGSVNSFNVGDEIFDKQTDTSLGVIKKISHEKAYEYINMADGSITEPREIPDKYDVYLEMESKGKKSSDGFYLNGNKQVNNTSSIHLYSRYITCLGQIKDLR